MGRRCCVVGCNSTTRLPEHHGVTYHSFPLDSTIRTIWLRNSRFSNERQITKSVLVCSRHFRRADFQPQRSGKYLLKPRVFPTVFPWGRVDTAQIEADLETVKKIKPLQHTVAPTVGTPTAEDATKATVEATVAQILKETATLNAAAAAENKNALNKDESASASPAAIKFEPVTEFVSGARIEAQDFDGNWHTARVVEVDNDDREVLIKFERTGKTKSAVVGAEEWISMNSTRLRQRATTKPVPVFELEEKCLARWSGPRKFPGTIKKVLGNNAYEVLFDDGYVKNVRAVHMVKLETSAAVAENDEKTKPGQLAAAQSIATASTPIKTLPIEKPAKEEPAVKTAETTKRSSTGPVKDWPLLDMSKIDLSSLNLPQIPHDGEWTCHWVNDQPIGREGFLIVGEHRKPTVIVDDWRLPSGWVKHMYQRSNLLGKWDVILVSPIGKRFRSKADLKQFLEEKGQVYNPDVYDFSIHRRRAKDINAYAFTPGYTPHQPYKTKVNTSANTSTSNTTDLLPAAVATPSAVQYIETPVAGAAPPAELLNAAVDVKLEAEDKKPDLSTSVLSSDSPTKSSTILEDGYAYVGGLKVQIVDNLFRCPEVGCSKNFRKENHLQIHIKHYHQNLTKLLGACPKMQELAEKRTHTLPDPNEPQPKNQISNQEFFAKMHQQDIQNSRSRGKNPQADSPDLVTDIKKELTMNLKDEIKSEMSDTENITLNSTTLDSTINTTAESSTMLALSSADDSGLNVSNLPIKRARFSPTKRVSGARKSNRQRTTRRYLTAAHGGGAAIGSTPVTSDNHFGVSDFEETRHSFNATPDAKLLDTKKRKSIAASVTPIDSPITADSGSSSIHISAPDVDVINRPEYIKENGQLIKIVRMRQEEIINCVCGFYEEDGLMIQCELCLCWQHGSCNEIYKESEVPEKYICAICRNPQRARESMLYKHDQDWLYDGKLPIANYHTESGSLQKRFDYLKLTHTLTGNLLELKDYIHSLRVKANIAGNRCHPKLYLWAKKWDDVKGDVEEKVNTETKPGEEDQNSIKVDETAAAAQAAASMPNIPQPEAAIDTNECQQRLLEHIKVQQAKIATRLDLIEADIDKIEKEDELDELKGSNISLTKDVLSAFVKDLEIVKQLAKLNSLEHTKKAVALMNAQPQ